MRTLIQNCAVTIAVCSLLGVVPVSAQDDKKQKTGPKRFHSVLELKQKGVGTVLIGGREARSTDFPASFYARSDGGSCTGTLVSSRVMLIAAHCMDNGAQVVLNFKGTDFAGTCTHAPTYKNNPTADWALCLLGKDVTGIQFEKLNTDASHVKVGTELLLSGYGCVKSPGTGGNDGIYRIGEVGVTQIPAGNSNDILTKGGVALCFGDSGGPAFLYLDANKRDRVVVSVNSRGNIKDTSYLSSVTTQSATDFLTSWSAQNSAKLCGLHADAANCRKAQ